MWFVIISRYEIFWLYGICSKLNFEHFHFCSSPIERCVNATGDVKVKSAPKIIKLRFFGLYVNKNMKYIKKRNYCQKMCKGSKLTTALSNHEFSQIYDIILLIFGLDTINCINSPHELTSNSPIQSIAHIHVHIL